MISASSTDDVQQAVHALETVRVVAGGSKTAQSSGANLSLASLAGVLEYDPAEYTFTALAGTKLADIEHLLGEKGQYLPFDPPLVAAGGTLGGTIAAGVSGPGRFRFGGVRDFLLGIRFVAGDGALHQGGGKVVKNAAGFDFPKLMVGAQGAFGIITEVTFKVFPRPREFASLVVEATNLKDAVRTMNALSRSNFELACLDFEPPHRILIRIGGMSESLPRRCARIQEFVGQSCPIMTGTDDHELWSREREFAWQPSETTLIKIPLNPGNLPEVESQLSAINAASTCRRYSVGGNVLWLAWPDASGRDAIDQWLTQQHRPAVPVIGQPWGPLGTHTGGVFADRLRSILDPDRKLVGPPSVAAEPTPHT